MIYTESILLKLSADELEILNNLSQKHDRSKSMILRRALKLYKLLDGGDVTLQKGNKPLKIVL